MLGAATLLLASLIVAQTEPESGSDPSDAPTDAPTDPPTDALPAPAAPNPPSAPRAVAAVDDEETALHMVLGAELGAGGIVPIAPFGGGLPSLHARQFIAFSLGRFTLQLEAAVESAVIIIALGTTSVSALYAIDATSDARFELGIGAGAGLMGTVFSEDGGVGTTGNVFLIVRRQWWFDNHIGFGLGGRLGVGTFRISSFEGPGTNQPFLAPAVSAHIALRL